MLGKAAFSKGGQKYLGPNDPYIFQFFSFSIVAQFLNALKSNFKRLWLGLFYFILKKKIAGPTSILSFQTPGDRKQ
jgi:hypothetical protein